MRGTIKKRGKRYYIIYDEGRDPVSGKRRQRWVSAGDTKKEAERKLTEEIHKLNTGSYIEPAKVTVGQFLSQWLTDYVWSNVGPSTATVYEHMLRKHLIPGLGAVKLSALHPIDIQSYLAQKLKSGRLDGKGGLNSKTVRHHYVTLHTALESAIKWGLLSRNPADAVDPPKSQRKEMRTLDEVSLRRVLEAAKDTNYYSIFYLALFTGMRRSELLALRWKDIDLDAGTVTVNRRVYAQKGNLDYRQPKTDKGRRSIPLPPSATQVMQRHKSHHKEIVDTLSSAWNDDALVFVSELGEPIHPDTLTHAWSKLVRRLNLSGVRLHDSRHTHASIMLRQGVHPKIVSERLGHANIQITLDTYSHVLPGLQEAAANAFDVGLGVGPMVRDNEAAAD